LDVTQVGDAGLKELSKLHKIKALLMRGTPLTDRGLKDLPGRESLRRLNLAGTRISDAGLDAIKGLRLQSLSLDNSIVSDHALAVLRQTGLLEVLSIESASDDDFIQFGNTSFFPYPTWDESPSPWLKLSGTRITDKGLIHLVGLQSLSVDLSNTKITDAGITTLAQMRDVHNFDLTDTKVTAAGVSQLRMLLPNCEIRSATRGPLPRFPSPPSIP
jgi:hypothetical protein